MTEEQELEKTAKKVDLGKTKVVYFIAGVVFRELIDIMGAVDFVALMGSI